MLNLWIFYRDENRVIGLSINEEMTVVKLVTECMNHLQINPTKAYIKLYQLDHVAYEADVDFDPKWIQGKRSVPLYKPLTDYIVSPNTPPWLSFCVVKGGLFQVQCLDPAHISICAVDRKSAAFFDHSGVESGEHDALKWNLPLSKTFQNAVLLGKNADAPSKAAMPREWIEAQRRGPNLTGRPPEYLGHPIGIYAPVFEDFKYSFSNKNLDTITPEEYSLAHLLIHLANAVYNDEDTRRRNIEPVLNNMLGKVALQIVNDDKSAADGSIMADVPNSQTLLAVEVAIYEYKPEITVGYSEANNEIAATARKSWVQDRVNVPSS
ncbi:hypothetical protein DACRYDRAFT_100818 [Dacryopinax primogenitus]|uniref:Uncharacterized protein n=1 Tax=Dacryopinax primogenitus (strain DJM 731) TaxID=1858805 RepID=M5G4N4_DACPD|nr:uncharacterized protein DACRYDRAFT_100818 [Dacryopinax primogenitus]EJU00822.1 hypothetical protein DACRYDRAFT_100818 [Dacryopinax primogenitus]